MYIISILNAGWIDDELRILHNSVMRFPEAEFTPIVRSGKSRACVSVLHGAQPAKQDFFAPVFLSVTMALVAIIYDAVIRGVAAASIAGGDTVHSQIVAYYLLNYDSEDQKNNWLPKMASGELVGVIAMTEPGAGVYQLHIVLREIRPAIWRRVLVRSGSIIEGLHYTIQLFVDTSAIR